ncbi:MAG: hypothetical protein J5643_06945 [Lachnospiraceae bacterium]|nr:hypothetical protein [Lachnospiraceae bacterium]
MNQIPDIFTFADGRRLTDPAEWNERAAELRRQYEDCMYGQWRSGETVSYTIADEGAQMISFFGIIPAEGAKNLTVIVSVNGKEGSWSMPVFLPDPAVPKPEGGYPVIISMHGLPSMEAALSRGYAVIPNNSTLVASDDIKHDGAFYELYPYGDDPKSQTGVLMAWSWGASKILDALFAGAAAELGINPELSIVTGVSRWGKATAVCGAFDPRFRLVAPACSGAGGLALYRYTSEGRTYNLSGVGASDAYTYGTNEPLSCLQSDAERGWFNEAFRGYASPDEIPLEQYELAALSAAPDRSFFLIAACTGEDWVNAPSMWECFREADKLYSFLGLEDRFVCHFHKEGHAVLEEDFELMLPYFDLVIRGLPVSVDLASLKTSVYKGQEQ